MKAWSPYVSPTPVLMYNFGVTQGFNLGPYLSQCGHLARTALETGMGRKVGHSDQCLSYILNAIKNTTFASFISP